MVPTDRLIRVLNTAGYHQQDFSEDYILFRASGLPDIFVPDTTEIELEEARAILLTTQVNIPPESWRSLTDKA